MKRKRRSEKTDFSDVVDDRKVSEPHGSEEVEHFRGHEMRRNYIRTRFHVRRQVLKLRSKFAFLLGHKVSVAYHNVRPVDTF